MRPSTFLFLIIFSACGESLDGDGDGFDELDGDCDDDNRAVHPNSPEMCDGIDNNCDGRIDEGSAIDGLPWHADADHDGYGIEGYDTTACEAPPGYAAELGDCNDQNPDVHPSADELCDFIDNNCDGNIDEEGALDAPVWRPDLDGDGYGSIYISRRTCSQPESYYILESGDCDDANASIHPAAAETCETPIDDNCNGIVNEHGAISCSLVYADLDEDGYPGSEQCLCEAEDPYLYSEASDCDDANPAIYPGQSESSDWSDDDCDGLSQWMLSEAPAWTEAGSVLAFAGELNHDGLDDLLTADPYDDSAG